MSDHLSSKKEVSRSEWEWFGYAGHFICANSCRFRLCTKVGDFLISTVGDMWVEDYSKTRKPGESRQMKRDTIGAGGDSFFETYVFKAGPRCSIEGCMCGQPTLADASEIDGERCATGAQAQALHLKYCEKYSKRPAVETTGEQSG